MHYRGQYEPPGARSGRPIAAVDHPVWGLSKAAFIQAMVCVMAVPFIFDDTSTDKTVRWALIAVGATTVWMILHALVTAPSFRRPVRFVALLAFMAVYCLAIPLGIHHVFVDMLGLPFWAVFVWVVTDLVYVLVYNQALPNMLFPEGVPAQPGT